MTQPLPVDAAADQRSDVDLPFLYHRLNNQLGVVLAHAELLESKAASDLERARATQVVASLLDALATTKMIRHRTSLVGRAQ